MPPDFRMQPNAFPIASIVNAAQRKGELENDLTLKQSEMLNQSMNAIGKIGESLAARRLQVAQALAGSKLFAQTDQGKQLLGENTVASVDNRPVTNNMTAQGTDDMGNILPTPVPNQSPVTQGDLATVLQGASPKDLLSHLFPNMVNESELFADASGKLIGRTTRKVPKGSSKTVVRPQAPSSATKLKSVGVNPDDGSTISYDPAMGTNVDASGNPYTGRILPTTEGSEEQRRGVLAKTGIASINTVRDIVNSDPNALSEIKKIRLSPGRVFSQIASSNGKALYNNLREAIANNLYLESGATANPQELENMTISYLAALNDNKEDFLGRMDLLEAQTRPHDSRRRVEAPKPKEKQERKTPGGVTYTVGD